MSQFLANSAETSDSGPTHVRYRVVLVAVLMSVLLYLDRFCASFAAPYIKEDLNLNNSQMAWFLGVFFLSYAFGQVPAGWLSDRFGPRAMLTIYVLSWSLMTGMLGLATGFYSVLAMRLGMGVGQAGAFPAAASLLSKWMPFASRGKASSAVAFGGRVGGAIAPIVTAYLIVMFVPASTSSQLTADDLFHYRLIGGDAADAGRSSIYKRVREWLPSETLTALDASPPPSDESGAKQRVADGLNRLLESRDFYDAEALRGLALPNEALRLLARPRESWSDDETERLNRLVLEAAFPDHIRKIYAQGWRPVMYTYALAGGLLVGGLCWLMLRDRPQAHPGCNEAEIALIHGSTTAGEPQRPARHGVPLRELAFNRSMTLNSLSQVGTNIGWAFLVTLLPRYLAEVHQVPVEMRGWMAAAPLFAGWFGMVYGGQLTDALARSIGLRWGRALPMAISKFIAVAAYLVCLLPLAEWFGPQWTPWILTAAFSLVAIGTDLGIGSVWAFCQDVGGRHVGSVLGWGNMWGNLGAFASAPLLNWVVGESGEHWNLAFLTCAGAFFVAGLAALGVDATRPIVPDETDAT